MVLGAVGVWWFKFASDEVKARIEETTAPLMGGLSSAWRLLVEGAVRLKERVTGEYTSCLSCARQGMCTWHRQICSRMCVYAKPNVTSCIAKSPPHVQDRCTMHSLLPTMKLVMPSSA